MSKFYPIAVVVALLAFVDYQWPNTVEVLGDPGNPQPLGSQILDAVNEIVAPLDISRGQ